MHINSTLCDKYLFRRILMKKGLFLVLALLMVVGMAASADAGQVDSKYDVTFYGYVKLDAVYMDSYAVMDNFLVQVPAGNRGGNTEFKDRDSFSMTARQSRFGFLITTPATDSGLITRGRLEADFYGSLPGRLAAGNQDPEENKGGLMLRRATVEIIADNWSILAGNEWMVVSPIFPHVNNYPYGADAGNLGYRTPQIRLTGYMMDKSIILQLAATNKLGDMDTLDIDTGRMSGTPAWEAGVTYKKDGLMVALTGHYGEEEIQTDREGLGADYYGSRIESQSINLSFAVPLGDMFAISGEYFTGSNLDGWYTGAQGSGWVVDADGDREAVNSQGGWVELMAKPVDGVKCYVGYGVDDVDDDQLEDGTIEPGYSDKDGNSAITMNSMTYANVYYNVSPSTMVAFEWMQMTSEYDNADEDSGLDWDDGVVNRYTLSFWYIF